uniref:Bactericidal permeability-increasing protein n=2 Tax=Varanus komodoensis TaxID=61221 RepID=A0A8D2L2L3_VARKO
MAECRRILLWVLTCLGLVLAEEDRSPAVMARITTKGLEYGLQKGVALLQQELSQTRLPDVTGKVKIIRGLEVQYKFHRLSIHDFQLPKARITPLQRVGLLVSIFDAFAELRGLWRVDSFLARASGHLSVEIEGISVFVRPRLGVDSSGKLTAAISYCITQVSEIRMKISSRQSSLSVFLKDVTEDVKRALEEQVCEVVTKVVELKVHPHLQSLPVRAMIDKAIGVDFSLVGPPLTTLNSLDIGLKGEFFSSSGPAAAPASPPRLCFPAEQSRMVYLATSSHFLSQAAEVFYQAGRPKFEITSDMIPGDAPVQLNTASFQSFIPQLQKLYPDAPMKLWITPSSAPLVTVDGGSLRAAAALDIQALAILPDAQEAPLFLLQASSSVAVRLAVESGRLVPRVELGR